MYEEYEQSSMVRALLLKYPYSAPWDSLLVDHGQIVERQLSDRNGAGAAIVDTGTIILPKRPVVTRRLIQDERANFDLIMWRATNDDEFRLEISNFLKRLMFWFNQQNASRGKPSQLPELPTFGNIETRKEQIYADGGIRTQIIDAERSEFRIGIHADYKRYYP